MHRAEAFLLLAIVIASDVVARLFAGFNEGRIKRVLHFVTVVNAEFTIATSVRVVTFVPGFSFLEIGEARLIIPALCAVSFPFVKVFSVAAYVYHSVNG